MPYQPNTYPEEQNITKSEIVRLISKKTLIDPNVTEAVVDAFILVMKKSIAKGEIITLRGLGTFKPHLCKFASGWDFKNNKKIKTEWLWKAQYLPSGYIKDNIKHHKDTGQPQSPNE